MRGIYVLSRKLVIVAAKIHNFTVTYMPLVSVGIPVYNSEKFLEQALECICNQSLQDIEIVISDNGSTDSTPDIIRKFAEEDNRIIFHQQKENIKALPNYRFLLAEAKSEFFLWRAYDDWSDPDYLKTLYGLLKNRPDYSLAVGKIVRKRLDGSVAGEKEFPGVQFPGKQVSRAQMLRISHPGWLYGLFRTSDLERAYDEVLTNYPHIWAFDHLVLAPFILEKKIVGTNETCFYQRETGLSQSNYKPSKSKDQIRLICDFMKFMLAIIARSKLPFLESWRLRITLIGYTNGRTEKFRRILRRSLLSVFK